MGLQPLDLSTMYSQLNNVSKMASSQVNAMNYANTLSNEQAKLEAMEKSQSVKEVSSSEQSNENQTEIKEKESNSRESGNSGNNSKSKNEKNEEPEKKVIFERIKAPGTGTIVDIDC
ncbi:MAG: hypothetical protein MR449_07175 [Spirochaetia bacterium]|nr:hypothetical protein [Spirochaetia bacterium]